MRFKHYLWVVNLFLCGRVWQLYGNQAILVMCKIVIVRHRFCWVQIQEAYNLTFNPLNPSTKMDMARPKECSWLALKVRTIFTFFKS